MNLFKKYPSIENTYREKEIEYWLLRYPEFENEEYTITEKIHGANFSLIVTEKKFFLAKRSDLIEEGESFYGIQNIIKQEKYQALIKAVQKYIQGKEEVESITLFGEFFGGSIQKGVDYGKEKKMLFYDMLVNGAYQTQEYFLYSMRVFDFAHLVVPVIGRVKGLTSAINYPTYFNSMILGIEDNICEGIVIKPYKAVLLDGNGSPFYLKKKNEAFKEKQKMSKRSIDKEEEFPEDIKTLHEEFLSYITENRLQSVFSHEGEISDKAHIGKYIRLMMNDAKEDFYKDSNFKEEEYDKPTLKYIFNVGDRIVKMLFKYV